MIETFSPNNSTPGAATRNGVCLRIADIQIVIRSAEPEPQIQIVGPMSEFVVGSNDSQPDMKISVRWGGVNEDDGNSRMLFDSNSVWKLYEVSNGCFEFRLSAPFSNWQPYKIARFDASWRTGEILCRREYFKPDQAIYPLEYPLDEVLVSNLLGRGRGIEIHGCGLVDADNRGLLFAGQSGAGKSTMAGLWERAGVHILSDERVILRKKGERIWMYGTPWHGEGGQSSAGCAELDQIFFLGRGAHNETIAQGRVEAAARLFACSFPPFYSASAIEFTLEFLDDVTRHVACDELRFVPDEKVIDFIRENASALVR